MEYLREKAWSPYVAGVIIGLLQIPAFLLIQTALGASSSYVSVAAYIAAVFDPAVEQISYFKKHMTDLKYAWQTALVVGIAVGAFLSMRLSGATRETVSPVWRQAANIQTPQARMIMGFIGGFVLLFGARLAGGCTSGHGLSGMAQLAASSTIAVIAMFAGGIATAFFLRKL
ncbi:MAG: YeeE/YedE thiosulfate transporter family protein [Rhodospirillales bacterium]